MSHATKRKHVMMEMFQDDFSLPNENQTIVRVISSKGNNLHEVKDPEGSTYLVSMPTKFRKNVWVKRGDYILVEPIVEGAKVKGEMVRLLTSEHIKCFKKDGAWPEAFGGKDNKSEDAEDLFVNTNRPVASSDSDDSSDSSAEENDK